jgi:hypothetical protein
VVIISIFEFCHNSHGWMFGIEDSYFVAEVSIRVEKVLMHIMRSLENAMLMIASRRHLVEETLRRLFCGDYFYF